MSINDIIILGIIQGITEFLPISSSGHLVIAQHILGIKSPGNTLEVLFHFGTLLSVFYVFFTQFVPGSTRTYKETRWGAPAGGWGVLSQICHTCSQKMTILHNNYQHSSY